MPPTPAANEQTLLENFLPVRDSHERLALITEACAGPGIPEPQRFEANLVAGCVSRVWLRRSGAPDVLHLEWEAESSLVRGLVGLLCQVYQDTDPATATTYRSGILSALGLDRQLSPTRLRGLAAMELRIQQLASS